MVWNGLLGFLSLKVYLAGSPDRVLYHATLTGKFGSLKTQTTEQDAAVETLLRDCVVAL